MNKEEFRKLLSNITSKQIKNERDKHNLTKMFNNLIYNKLAIVYVDTADFSIYEQVLAEEFEKMNCKQLYTFHGLIRISPNGYINELRELFPENRYQRWSDWIKFVENELILNLKEKQYGIWSFPLVTKINLTDKQYHCLRIGVFCQFKYDVDRNKIWSNAWYMFDCNDTRTGGDKRYISFIYIYISLHSI